MLRNRTPGCPRRCRRRGSPLVVVSVDGLGMPLFQRLRQLPALAAMEANGATVEDVVSVLPSLTYPAHATLLTGLSPRDHGVVDNLLHSPVAGPWDWNWHRSRIRGDTVADAAQRAGCRVGALLWPGLAGARLSAVFPEIMADPARGENQVWLVLRNGSPGLVLRAEWRFGRIRRGSRQPELDDYITALACDLLRRRRVDLLLLHLVDLDDFQHGRGPDDPGIGDGLVRMDRRIGRIRDALRETHGPGGIRLVVLGDHAQLPATDRLDLSACLRARFPSDPPRVLMDGGCAYVGPREDAEWRRYLESLPQAARVLGPDEMARESTGQPGDGFPFLVMARPGAAFAPADETVGGTHGYDPGIPGYTTVFCAEGPGVRPGVRVPGGDLRQAAPTLAALLEIPFPQAPLSPFPILNL